MKQVIDQSTSVSVPEFDDPIPATGDYFRGLVGQPLTAYADRVVGLESGVDPGVFPFPYCQFTVCITRCHISGTEWRPMRYDVISYEGK